MVYLGSGHVALVICLEHSIGSEHAFGPTHFGLVRCVLVPFVLMEGTQQVHGEGTDNRATIITAHINRYDY